MYKNGLKLFRYAGITDKTISFYAFKGKHSINNKCLLQLVHWFVEDNTFLLFTVRRPLSVSLSTVYIEINNKVIYN